jgi:H+/Cl- antiporter ClcA
MVGVRSSTPSMVGGWMTDSRPEAATGASGGRNQPGGTVADPLAVLRTRRYVGLLVIAAILGAPIAAAAYWFLKLTTLMQTWVYTDLPDGLGVGAAAAWWPVVPLLIAGIVVGLTIRYLPGTGGESPVDGFRPGGLARPATLPGIAIAALASIGLGAVVGPEGPLVALGGGLAYLAVWLAKRDVPAQAGAVVAATGSFAAISTLLGSPLAAAFLLMEASGLGGATATMVLVPGLLGAGIGALIFTGLDSLTGYGTFSLAIPDLPAAGSPTIAEFGYAIAIGLAAPPLCVAIRFLALRLRPHAARHPVLLTPLAGLAVAALAIIYTQTSGKPVADVLFSGQDSLPRLVETSASYSIGALLLLVVCKGLAYSISMSSFRGGPTFPAMFIGAAGGIALSHLPGLALVPAIGIGIAAMTVSILRLPLTTVLLTTIFLGTDGFPVMPLVIVAAAVSYITTIRLTPPPTPTVTPQPEPHVPVHVG